MEDLDKVNIERASIINTLNTEKSLMEVLCNKKDEELAKEIKSPAYSGLEVVDMIKNFLEWNKSLRAIDQRIIKEMDEWVKAVRRVVIGVESQESKLKEYQQMVDTLRLQLTKETITKPVFKQPVDKVDEKIEEIESSRLTNEQLEKAKNYFLKVELKARFCWYVYNQSKTAKEIETYFKLSPTSGHTILKRYPDLFGRAGRTEKKEKLYITTAEGKALVEKIIKLGETGKLGEY